MPATAGKNAVLEQVLAELADARTVLDVGCGAGGLVRTLEQHGFVATGVDPQESVLAVARTIAPDSRFVTASAEALPFDDTSFDAVVFLNSLHHISPSCMDRALAEAARCVSASGCVIVVEPLPEGSMFDVVRLIDDETEVRRLAQEALDRFALPGLSERSFNRMTDYADSAEFLSSLIAAEPNRRRMIEANREQLIEVIVHSAATDCGWLTLCQPMRLRRFGAGGSEP